VLRILDEASLQEASGNLDVLSVIDAIAPEASENFDVLSAVDAIAHQRSCGIGHRQQGTEVAQRHNLDNAGRAEDRIDDFRVPRPVVSGTGKYQQWLPETILRCCFCFARSIVCSKRRKSVSRPRAFQSNPSAVSARTMDTFCTGSHTHVLNVPQVSAFWSSNKQQLLQAMMDFADLAHRIVLVVLDETEFIMNLHSEDVGVKSDHVSTQLMMLHGRVRSRFQDGRHPRKTSQCLQPSSPTSLRAPLVRHYHSMPLVFEAAQRSQPICTDIGFRLSSSALDRYEAILRGDRWQPVHALYTRTVFHAQAQGSVRGDYRTFTGDKSNVLLDVPYAPPGIHAQDPHVGSTAH